MSAALEDLVLRHAYVLDPGTDLDGIMDVRISSGRITEIGENLRGTRELDADGLHLFPGLVDVHAHWRTPGREDEEDIESGSAAAAAGGFTSVVMMPNTDPVVDKPVIVSGLVRRTEQESRIRAYISAALHEGLARETVDRDAATQRGRRVLRLGRRSRVRLRRRCSATGCSTPGRPGCR